MISLKLLNPDDEDIKDRINKNLDIFFKSNQFLNELIDDIINNHNEYVNINKEDFKEYIFNDFKNYSFKSFINSYYNYPINSNTTDNEILNINNHFNSNFINIAYDLSQEISNNYLGLFKNYLDTIKLKRTCSKSSRNYYIITPYFNLYLINKIKRDYEFLNNSIKNNYELTNNSIKQIKNDYEFLNNSIKDNYELTNNSIIDNSNNYRYIIRYIKDIKEENKIFRFFLVINFSLIIVILNIFDLRI
jgi:hypothetical protein